MTMKKTIAVILLVFYVTGISAQTKALRGKRLGVLGDSYVTNHKDVIENTWHYKFAMKYGMQYLPCGKGGNCIAVDDSHWGIGMYRRYKDMADSLDYVIVIGGHNDSSKGRIGNVITIEKFKERLAILCEGLIDRYPTAKIFFFTPWTIENFMGSPRQQVVDAMKEVCGSYGIPVFDAARQGNMFVASEAFRRKYMQGKGGADHAHLNAKGHERFLPTAEHFILQHIEE